MRPREITCRPSAGEWYYVDEDGKPIVTEDGSIDYARLEELYSDPKYDYLAVKVIIHDNITWSDGVPLTVEDVYYSLDLATNHALSNHAGALAWTSDLKHKYNNGVLVERGLFTYERSCPGAGLPDFPGREGHRDLPACGQGARRGNSFVYLSPNPA